MNCSASQPSASSALRTLLHDSIFVAPCLLPLLRVPVAAAGAPAAAVRTERSRPTPMLSSGAGKKWRRRALAARRGAACPTLSGAARARNPRSLRSELLAQPALARIGPEQRLAGE